MVEEHAVICEQMSRLDVQTQSVGLPRSFFMALTCDLHWATFTPDSQQGGHGVQHSCMEITAGAVKMSPLQRREKRREREGERGEERDHVLSCVLRQQTSGQG